jgi:hypothetical protein
MAMQNYKEIPQSAGIGKRRVSSGNATTNKKMINEMKQIIQD